MATPSPFLPRTAFVPQLLAFGFIALVAASSACDSSSSGSDDDSRQVDRTALPAVNTALIAPGRKDAFNQGDPATDVAEFEAEMEANLQSLRTAVNGIQGFPAENLNPPVPVGAVVDIVNPDVFTIDLSKPLTFPNGRAPEEDVMDTILGLVLNRGTSTTTPSVSDAIDANDAAFLPTMPYLAPPN